MLTKYWTFNVVCDGISRISLIDYTVTSVVSKNIGYDYWKFTAVKVWLPVLHFNLICFSRKCVNDKRVFRVGVFRCFRCLVSVRQTTTNGCFWRCVSLALWPQDLEGRGLHGSYRRKETSLTLVLCSTATQGGYYCQLHQEFDCKPRIGGYYCQVDQEFDCKPRIGGYYCQVDQEFDCKPRIASYFH